MDSQRPFRHPAISNIEPIRGEHHTYCSIQHAINLLRLLYIVGFSKHPFLFTVTINMKQRLLIIEDESLILLSLSMTLQSKTTEITTASNGANGLLQISNSPDFDLYIIDLTLPDMDGHELVKMIYKKQPQANVIVMTGKYLNKQEMLQAMPDGMKKIDQCHFLAKPFDIDKVEELVSKLLQNTQPDKL